MSEDLVAGVAVERLGSGAPVVLLHGLGSSRQVWAPVLDAVARQRHVVAVDLPGFGQSPGPAPVDAAGRASVGAFADTVAGLLAELGLTGGERPAVAGSSLGGGIALELGRRGLARSVTAFAPVGFWGRSGSTWCRGCLRGARAVARHGAAALPALVARPAGRAVLAGLFCARPRRLPAGQLLAQARVLATATAFDAACAAFAEHRFPAEPGRLDEIPVTLVWGTRDVVLPFGPQGRRARTLLPLARRVVLPGCGHLPFTDAPQTCARLLLDTESPADAC